MSQSSWTRRAFLGGTIGVAGLRKAHAQEQRPPVSANFLGVKATVIHSELKQLAPTVYAFLQREAPGQSNLSESNFGLVVGSRRQMEIAAGGVPHHERKIIEAAS